MYVSWEGYTCVGVCVTDVPVEGVFGPMALHSVLLLRHPVISADTSLLSSLLPPVSVLILLFFPTK